MRALLLSRVTQKMPLSARADRAVACWLSLAAVLVALSLSTPARAGITPFPLSDVRLLNSSFHARYERLNSKYLLEMLDPDRLLLTFRINAKLPTRDAAPYTGSWEDPGCELRGHFVGHYLSALSLAYASTGNRAFKERLSLMVAELSKVQEALGGEYLSAFPTAWFDRLESLKAVWAPYYTIHKILAGLLDAYELAGEAEGLPMASRSVAYHWRRTQALIEKKGIEYWQKTLEFEFGGMNEVLYRLYGITREPAHLDFARLFDKRTFVSAMVQNKNVLYDLHANTHLAQVVGFAAAYDTIANDTLRTAVQNFWGIVTEHHGFATGGTSVFERWWKSDEMAFVVSQRDGPEWVPRNALKTHETCTQYNMLKLARSLFTWTGDVFYADHYERALVNGMLGLARLPPEEWPEDQEHLASAHHSHDHSHDHSHSHHHHHHRRRHSRELSTLRRELVAHGGPGSGLGGFGNGAAGAGFGGVGGKKGVQVGTSAGALTDGYRRLHDDEWGDFIGFRRPKPDWNASDAPGPGVFLYLLPMGHGQSKSDNLHHWGFPFHSFWCCYGTAIEAYAKLADSIYFRDMSPTPLPDDPASMGMRAPPRLYVNQYTSSELAWRDFGLRVTMAAEQFAPGPAQTAEIRFARLPAAAAAPGADPAAPFTLMLRIPAWAVDGGVLVTLNGQAYNGCPGSAVPSTYCRITRQWNTRDVVFVSIALRWWYSPVQDNRAQYHDMKAIMMGPHMMVALSHDDYMVGGPNEAIRGYSLDTPGPDDLMHPLAVEEDELISLQASWHASLFLRHDAHIAYMSEVEDGGDALDATFRLGRGCYRHPLGWDAEAGGGEEEGADEMDGLAGLAAGRGGGSSQASSSGVFGSLRTLMRLGQHDTAQALSLEAMGYPNHFLAYDHTDLIVLQPGPAEPGAKTRFAPCDAALWMMRPGLDGASDTVSFEAAFRPGHFLTALQPPNTQKGYAAAACKDVAGADCAGAVPHACGTVSFIARVLCRRTCGSCGGVNNALRLRELLPGSLAFAAASSFRLAAPKRLRYPAGSHVLAGSNRHYLLSPIGNLVDERYSAYFTILIPERVPALHWKRGHLAAATTNTPKPLSTAKLDRDGIRSSLQLQMDSDVGMMGWPTQPSDEQSHGSA